MRKWQTVVMSEAMALLEPGTTKDVKVEPDSSINEEVPWNDAKPLMKQFSPEVSLVGLGLWRERYGVSTKLGRRAESGWRRFRRRVNKEYQQIDSWGGVYGRVMRNKDDSWRCLQYIYTYTRQQGTVSLIWNTSFEDRG
jgi:hypothetical protein